MLCKKCGKEITDDAVSCQYCGEHFQERDKVENQIGSITICREKAVSAALAPAKVSIDGKPYCALTANERTAVSLLYGKHSVSIRVAMNPAATFTVDLEPSDPAPVLSFKIDLNGKAVMIGEENGIVPVKKKRNNAVRILAILILLAVMLVIIIIGKLTKNDAPDNSAGAAEVETNVIPCHVFRKIKMPPEQIERQIWQDLPESNQRGADLQSAALPTELRSHGMRGGGSIMEDMALLAKRLKEHGVDCDTALMPDNGVLP